MDNAIADRLGLERIAGIRDVFISVTSSSRTSIRSWFNMLAARALAVWRSWVTLKEPRPAGRADSS